MRDLKIATAMLTIILGISLLPGCGNKGSDPVITKDSTVVIKDSMGGYSGQVKWGEHLAMISGCNDCHTPKKMGAAGPEPDMTMALSGHPAALPVPDVDRKNAEAKGLAITNDLTVWVGPWGVSFAANITSDSTGIGNWKEDQFLTCIRQGKYKGLATSRSLLPPMPWQALNAAMSDDELKAIFAYLKSTVPVHNVVPQSLPPLTAAK
jgi:hypothetical protein